MPGIHFARVRAMIPLADVLNLVGFVPCETSRDQVRRAVSGPSFYLANEPQLLRKSEEAHLQMLHMWLKRKSIRSVCISDRTESLRGSHCPLRAARPRDPLDTGGQAKPGARQPNGPVKSRRGSAESCTRIPARNHPGGSILAAIMAQFLTAIDTAR